MHTDGQRFTGRRFTFYAVMSLFMLCAYAAQGFAAAPQKAWTFIIYLNGNNSLDSFGTDNMKMMETVGSTDTFNIVVQWASESAGNTRRFLIQKSTDPNNVTSPVVQQLPVVDMGNYQTMIDFATWAVQNYPAQHYFLDVWDHGNGWHKLNDAKRTVRDISWDDVSGNHITTAQFGQAVAAIAQVIGHPLDLVGTDACLMAMVEVTNELAGSALAFVGSQEVEPGLGWPYDKFLTDWAAKPNATNLEIGSMLSKEYVAYYQGQEDATLSVMDLSHQSDINTAITGLAGTLKGLSSSEQSTVKTATANVVHFYDSDYADLGDLISKLGSSGVAGLQTDDVRNVQTALSSFVVTNNDTTNFANAKGVSIWWPTDNSTLTQYVAEYQGLKFMSTNWLSVLQLLNP